MLARPLLSCVLNNLPVLVAHLDDGRRTVLAARILNHDGELVVTRGNLWPAECKRAAWLVVGPALILKSLRHRLYGLRKFERAAEPLQKARIQSRRANGRLSGR